MLFRIAVFITIVTFSTSLGCTTWRPMPSTYITTDSAEALEGKRVRLYTGDDVQTISVRKVEFPYVEGTEQRPSRVVTREPSPIRIDLREVDRIEILQPEGNKTVLIVSVAMVAIVVAFGILILFTRLTGY
jgi:hypothetical protein